MAVRKERNASGDAPVRIPLSRKEQRELSVALASESSFLQERFGGKENLSSLLRDLWRKDGGFNHIFDAAEEAYGVAVNENETPKQVLLSDGGKTLVFTYKELQDLHHGLSEALGEPDYKKCGCPQRVAWHDKEYLLPGPYDVTFAREVNGRPLFWGWEPGGMYGHRVFGPEGETLVKFGPYGPPFVVSVDGYEMLCTREDMLTGPGMDSPSVFLDENGKKLFSCEHDWGVKVDSHTLKEYLEVRDAGRRVLLGSDVLKGIAAGAYRFEKGVLEATGVEPARRKPRVGKGL